MSTSLLEKLHPSVYEQTKPRSSFKEAVAERKDISELFLLSQQGFRVEDYDDISTITLFSLIPASEALASTRENRVPGKGYPNTIRH